MEVLNKKFLSLIYLIDKRKNFIYPLEIYLIKWYHIISFMPEGEANLLLFS